MNTDQRFPGLGLYSTSDHFKQGSNQSQPFGDDPSSYDDLEEPEIDNILNLCSIQSGVNKGSAHNKSSYFDVTKFVPTGMKVRFTEKGGSLYIAHTVNEFAIKVLKRKVDLVIFQCMLRFTLGFRRPVCKLSYTFISNWTGIQIPNVRRGVSNLLEMGLVRIAIPHSSRELKATIYEVPIVREYLDWVLIKEKALNQDADQIYLHKQSDYNPMSKLITKKEKGKEKLETLSQKINLPSKLQTYIMELRPHQKRVGEEHFLNQLLVDYKPEEIVEALDHVQLKGTIDTQEAVHSPMKYLSYTIETVLSCLKERKDKLQRFEAVRKEAEAKLEREEREKNEEAELYRKASLKFESSLLTDEQEQYLDGYYQENYAGTGGFFSKNLVKKFAVVDWYKKNQ